MYKGLRKFAIAFSAFICLFNPLKAQQTVFERSGGKSSSTYAETIAFYKLLDQASSRVAMRPMGPTDANLPLHLVLADGTNNPNPKTWKLQGRTVLLIINGIHPGEPDGIDASLMLVRDIAHGKFKLPANIGLAIIPIYNIGGALNRGRPSRVNQDGPDAYGFRGNSQNLDLNRDFIKNDSREAISFAEIFHYVQPDILIDNHVSDGADYQHTMTLLTTQYDKLGEPLATWLRQQFEPALYASMKQKGWPMVPYVDFESEDPRQGMSAFYDPPRYSSGYGALWQVISFVPETHMLKPFRERTLATYALLNTFITTASAMHNEIQKLRREALANVLSRPQLPLTWVKDTVKSRTIEFLGYTSGAKKSDVTGADRLYYDRSKPFTLTIPFFDAMQPEKFVSVPRFYVLPQGWQKVVKILQANKVQMQPLKKDSSVMVKAFYIRDLKTGTRPYEGHYRHYGMVVDSVEQTIRFRKGDYLIPLAQPARRYLVETLDPRGDDGFFAWNFFDAVLQQKEGYSAYRWEDLAARHLEQNPSLRGQMNKELGDAATPSAQLYWVYTHSPYYEPEHNRHPVFSIE